MWAGGGGELENDAQYPGSSLVIILVGSFFQEKSQIQFFYEKISDF